MKQYNILGYGDSYLIAEGVPKLMRIFQPENRTEVSKNNLTDYVMEHIPAKKKVQVNIDTRLPDGLEEVIKRLRPKVVFLRTDLDLRKMSGRNSE